MYCVHYISFAYMGSSAHVFLFVSSAVLSVQMRNKNLQNPPRLNLTLKVVHDSPATKKAQRHQFLNRKHNTEKVLFNVDLYGSCPCPCPCPEKRHGNTTYQSPSKPSFSTAFIDRAMSAEACQATANESFGLMIAKLHVLRRYASSQMALDAGYVTCVYRV